MARAMFADDDEDDGGPFGRYDPLADFDDQDDVDGDDDIDEDDVDEEARGFGLARPMTVEDTVTRIAAAAGESRSFLHGGEILMPTGEMQCRVCGCTEQRACPGGCLWAAPNLCSRCVA